jgi:hypothetical protein
MKILYNVTIKIETSIKDEWLSWMIEKHIPDVMATKLFESYKITQIMGDDDEHGVGFAVQYIALNMDDFNQYQSLHSKTLQAEHASRYENRYVAFRTLMEVVSEG